MFAYPLVHTGTLLSVRNFCSPRRFTEPSSSNKTPICQSCRECWEWICQHVNYCACVCVCARLITCLIVFDLHDVAKSKCQNTGEKVNNTLLHLNISRHVPTPEYFQNVCSQSTTLRTGLNLGLIDINYYSCVLITSGLFLHTRWLCLIYVTLYNLPLIQTPFHPLCVRPAPCMVTCPRTSTCGEEELTRSTY